MSIKSNIRGDSGLSDSQFGRVQNHLFAKHAEEMASIDDWAEKERMKKRYASRAKPPKKGLWSRLRRFFTGK